MTSIHTRYNVTDNEIGKGTFSTVFRGEDRLTRSPVAIKKIVMETLEHRELAHLEGEFVKKLTASHAVRYRAVIVESPEQYWIVMDLVQGRNLKEVFMNNRMSFIDLISIVKRTLEFLVSLKKQNLVHFDLKPHNMIWDENSRTLTIIDFGSAREIGVPCPRGPSLTTMFAAPETVLGMKEMSDHDLWSLGCVLFVLFTQSFLIKMPKSLPLQDQNFYLIQQVVEQFGKPSPEYLAKCRGASIFFNPNGDLIKTWEIPKPTPWKVAIEEKCNNLRFSEQRKKNIGNLFNGLLSLENRIPPAELLMNPLFKLDITVQFSYDCRGMLSLHCASKPLAKPYDLTIDLKTYKRSCLFLPRDDKNKYILIFEAEGQIKKTITLEDGNTLDIKELQAQTRSLFEASAEQSKKSKTEPAE